MKVRLDDIRKGLFGAGDFDPYLVAIWDGDARWWRLYPDGGKSCDLCGAGLFTFAEAMEIAEDAYAPGRTVLFVRMDAAQVHLTSSHQRQQIARHWAAQAFAADAEGMSLGRRALRAFEESVELFQAVGGSAEDAHRLVDFVFGRVAGEPRQEIGQVMVTLLILAEVLGLSVAGAEKDELRRVISKPLALFGARNQAKVEAGF